MTASRNDFIHEVLGERYKLEKVIGKKAGRRMVIARDKANNQLVAVKILLFGQDFSWEDLKLFEREAEILKSIHHPFIPEYLDFFDFEVGKGKGYVLVQSYVEGKSLEDYIQARYKFSDGEIEEIASKLLSILEYLHQQKPPIIHRDIKPSNIIVQQKAITAKEKQKQKDSFTVYLVDFGSVQTCASKAGNTMTVVGTYGYMPPEQFGGRAYPASDLYSLGATLIACATGVQPADLPQQDMQIDFVRQTALRENLTTWLSWLTHPTLEHRPQTAQDAIAVLQQSTLISQKQYVPRRWLLMQIVFRNIGVGVSLVTLAAGLYGTFVFPVLGTYFGTIYGLGVGFIIAVLNTICISLITLDLPYPLSNLELYKKTIYLFSSIFGVASYIIGLFLFSPDNILYMPFWEMVFLILCPAIIIGFSLGYANKSVVSWYEKKTVKKV